jgi:alkanesulfonate monooxygenase SsuD/methylene tetrahydromethanopterin reductase-like flavin-dependent oxidoreductase (luciferase family)
MDIGIGLPNSVPGTTGGQLLEWARRAEAAGFSSLGTIGAVAYPTYEELTVFAAAGAITERIRFFSNVLLAPTRSAAELAKQAATVDQLTGGRLTLGLGVGWRASDYELTGRDFHERGSAFDAQLRDLQAAWAGEAIGSSPKPVSPPPVQAGGVPMIIGGSSEAAIRRVVQFGQGWAAGGSPPDASQAFIEQVRTAWQEAGREGTPRFTQLVYFSLGDTEAESRSYLLDYYEPFGDMAEGIASSALRTPEAIKGAIQAYADIGIDELYLDATVSDPAQVDLLAEVVF